MLIKINEPKKKNITFQGNRKITRKQKTHGRRLGFYDSFTHCRKTAILQEARCQFPNLATCDESQVRSCRICGGQSGI
jgi:hypothetical protein